MEQQNPRRLTKGHDRIIGGVASGFAEYLDLDPTIVRGAVVVLGLFAGPVTLLAYLLFLVILPPPSGPAPSGASERTGGIGPTLIIALVIFLIASWGMSWMGGWMMPHMWGVGRMWFGGGFVVPLILIGAVLFLLARGRTR
jgi:phage shock protein C